MKNIDPELRLAEIEIEQQFLQGEMISSDDMFPSSEEELFHQILEDERKESDSDRRLRENQEDYNRHIKENDNDFNKRIKGN